jgi:hypothetical protein
MMRMVLPGVLLLVAATASVATAQEREFGAKVGPSVAALSVDPDDAGEGYERQITVSGGGFAVLPLGRHFAAQFEVLSSRKGATLDMGNNLTGKVLLEYLDLPVLARINGPRFGSQSVHVFGGPYFGIRTSAKNQTSTSGGGFSSGERVNISPDIERFDMGLIGGLGVDIGNAA